MTLPLYTLFLYHRRSRSACANVDRKHINNLLRMLYSPVVFVEGTSDARTIQGDVLHPPFLPH